MNLRVLGFAVLLIAGPVVALADDLEDSLQSLKEAEANKDVALVKKLAGETSALARKVISSPEPESAEEKEAWSQRVTYARNVDLQTEYALYSLAVQAEPAVAIDLLSTLEQQNPKSKYLDESGYAHYFLALNQTGAAAKIPAVAEKAVANFPENEDLLLVLADAALNKKQSAQALTYAQRLVAVMNKLTKPEGISQADWARKRAAALGRGYWIAGLVQSERNQYYEADRNLRAALPFIKGNDAMTAAALFHLGVANYQLGVQTRNKARVLEGAKFSDQAAAIKGPFAQQAWRNAQLMRNEAQKMR